MSQRLNIFQDRLRDAGRLEDGKGLQAWPLVSLRILRVLMRSLKVSWMVVGVLEGTSVAPGSTKFLERFLECLGVQRLK